jgi:hypothetical protein
MADLPTLAEIEEALKWHYDEIEAVGGDPHKMDPEEVVLARVAEWALSFLRGVQLIDESARTEP